MTPKALRSISYLQKELPDCFDESHIPWSQEDFQTSHKGVFLLLGALRHSVKIVDPGTTLHFQFLEASDAQQIFQAIDFHWRILIRASLERVERSDIDLQFTKPDKAPES